MYYLYILYYGSVVTVSPSNESYYGRSATILSQISSLSIKNKPQYYGRGLGGTHNIYFCFSFGGWSWFFSSHLMNSSCLISVSTLSIGALRGVETRSGRWGGMWGHLLLILYLKSRSDLLFFILSLIVKLPGIRFLPLVVISSSPRLTLLQQYTC